VSLKFEESVLREDVRICPNKKGQVSENDDECPAVNDLKLLLEGQRVPAVGLLLSHFSDYVLELLLVLLILNLHFFVLLPGFFLLS